MTVREQQGRQVSHEKGEGEMGSNDTYANTFLQTLEPCVYVHTHEDVRMCADKLCNRKMRVREVSVCTPPVVHTVVATSCVRNLEKSVGKNSLEKK